jgi:YesN/AraC family two-component response regulator
METISQLENTKISDNYTDPVINAVKKADENEYKRSLENLIAVCHKYRYEIIVKTLANLSISIIKLTPDPFPETDTVLYLNYYEVYKRILEIGNLNELNQWFSELYLKVCTVLKDINARRIQDVMGSVINYIHEKYSEMDLSVNTITDRFVISPSYFSRIFNEFTGNSFPDYINNLRLEKAKEMLTQNSVKEISEIGYSVGYRSNTYFASSFKKRYGVTPSEFRKPSNLSNL